MIDEKLVRGQDSPEFYLIRTRKNKKTDPFFYASLPLPLFFSKKKIYTSSKILILDLQFSTHPRAPAFPEIAWPQT